MTKVKLAGGVLAAGLIVKVELGVAAVVGLALLTVLVLASWIWIRQRRFLPRNRVRAMRLRLHMRMRPGRGFATQVELFLRWGRFASWRESSRIRPSLSSWERWRDPSSHSVLLGHAQRRTTLRASRQEHIVLVAEPRSGKTLALGAWLMDHPGPAVVTESKIGLVQETSAVRSRIGPVETLNPGLLGAIPSTINFDPIAGADDPQTAIRRADAFAGAVSMKGTDGGDYFAAKCSSYLRALFMAAAITGGDMRLVARWALGSAVQAEQILHAAGREQWADELAELRGPAERSAATSRSVMSRALSFMNDDKLATAVLPGEFDIRGFLEAKGTLYLVASGQGEESPLAPLFACLVQEVIHTAGLMGSEMPGARLDPPLMLALDEVCQVCPIPLPTILSDAGGRGIQVVTVVHGLSALADRYGDHGAQTVMNTSSVKVFLPGGSEVKTLEMISRLSGDFQQRLRYQDHHTEHKVITEAMARSVPAGYGVIIRGGNSPVIAKMQRFYQQPEYRQARRNGGTLAALKSLTAPVIIQTEAVTEEPDAPLPWWVSD